MRQLIFSVVVAYNPNHGTLAKLCGTLSQYTKVIVVDNTPDGKVLLEGNVCTWVACKENLGIAGAQNIGIRMARSRGAQAVAFFDQDSQVLSELLPTLSQALDQIGSGVVVPVCLDARTGCEYPSFRINKIGWPSQVFIDGSQKLTPVDMAISSGSLVSSDVFDSAGLMDESLFIDYVDFEWCARVRSAGFEIMAVPGAEMMHAIGDFSIKSAGLHVFIHSPTRCYYRVRNPFHLLRYPHIRFIYAMRQIISALVQHLLQFSSSDNPRLHVQMGLKGLAHGLIGRRGRLSQ